MSKITAIVLAAGSGSRMQSRTKKQFMEIKGKPVLWYSLFALEQSGVDEVILVTGKEDITYCKEQIVTRYHFEKVSAVVAGGRERYESVANGLEMAQGEIVLIHDGARPLLTQDIIARCIHGAQQYGACVAGVPVKDTIKTVDADGVIQNTPDRSCLWITQTPQAFQSGLIQKAYAQLKEGGADGITDDAMVVERFTQHPVRFVEGAYTNIKITTPEDIAVAETLLTHLSLPINS